MRIELSIEGMIVSIEAEGGLSVRVTQGHGAAAQAAAAGDGTAAQAAAPAAVLPKAAPQGGAQAAADDDALAANGLFARLSDLRRELAVTQGVPTYVVFQDRALLEMAEKRPQTLDAFSRIKGVGKTKLEKYGDIFLSAIREGAAA